MTGSTGHQPSGRSALSRPVANYIRFSLKNVLIVVCAALVSLGAPWVYVVPMITTSLLVVVEELFADIEATEDMPPAAYLNAMLWLSLPLLVLLTLAVLNLLGPGLPALDSVLISLGFDPVAARQTVDGPVALTAVVGLGAFYSMAAANVAHELVHRTDSLFDLIVGRLLLAFTFDTGYAIDHVHGHHRHVGTLADPSTARRGEYAPVFVVRSIIGQNLSALRIEQERLRRRGTPDLPWTNRYWRGQTISLAYLAAAWLIAGWTGVATLMLAGLTGKVLHTLITYVEHYGLVRVSGERVRPCHAWSSNRRVSLGLLYNAPLHAEHHMFATRPFWKLRKAEGGDTPLLPLGSFPMALAALVPPLWTSIVGPRLAEWDRNLASDAERALLRERGQLAIRH